MTPILDIEDAKNRFDNDIDLYIELIDIFFSTLEQSISAIQGGLSEGSAKKITESAHSIKGALGNLGAKEAASIALIMEKAGRDGNLQVASDHFEKFREAIERFSTKANEIKANGKW